MGITDRANIIRKLFAIGVFGAIIGCATVCYSQSDTTKTRKYHETLEDQLPVKLDSTKQRDLADEIYKLLGKTNTFNKAQHAKKINFSVIPSLGYTLTTGFAVDITSNAAFYTDSKHDENLSAIVNDLVFDTKEQKLLYLRSEIWAKDNNYKFVGDIRTLEYPTTTYGLGSSTTNATADNIFFYYIRFYGTFYKKVIPDFYAGVGYNLDQHLDISEDGNANGTESDIAKYGDPRQTTSSGVNFSLLFDNRRNQLNPLGGYYANLIYRQNLTFLGSDENWQSLELDMRKYLRVSPSSNNILAFWGMAWFSSANTPYLDLPATGNDMYDNSGRGYAEGRYRGRDMLYLETEYRFGIMKNGLLGGVIFANGETFSGYQSTTFQKIAPGTGAGIRIKANKHSDSNICIDYGVGVNGSHGFFVNLGEVF
jgi:hypothetical protein